MPGAATAIIGGLMAGMHVGQLIWYVSSNVALNAWTRHRNKKKPQEIGGRQSSAPGTNVTIGDPIIVVFGVVNTGGTLFDSLTPSSGAYPVHGGIGYALPRYFSEGIELIDRNSIAFDGPQESLNYAKLTKDAESGAAVYDQTEIRKALKFSNDSNKKANNLILKFFSKGGFSAGSTGDILTLYEKINPDKNPFVVIPQDRYSRGVPSGGYVRSQGFYLDYSLPPINGEPATQIQKGDILIFYTGSDFVTREVNAVVYPYVRKDYSGTQAEPRLVGTTTFPNTVLVMFTTPVRRDTLQKISHVWTNYTKIDVLRFNGVTNRNPDSFLRFSQSNYNNNNHLGWLSVEVREPLPTTDPNVQEKINKTSVSTVPSIVGLIADESMQMSVTLPTNANNETFAFRVSGISKMWTNPIAIIYEILTDPGIGLGLDPKIHIDMDNFVTNYNKCKATDTSLKPSGGDEAWRFGGYVLANVQEAREYIQDILNHIHGDYVWDEEGKFKIFLNADEDYTQSFTQIDMRHIVRSEARKGASIGSLMFKSSYTEANDRYNELNVRYIKPDKEFIADYFLKLVDLPDITFSGTRKTKNMDLLGFMEDKYASKSANIHMARNALEDEFFEMELNTSRVEITAGQIIELVAFDSAEDNANIESQYFTVNSVESDAGDHILVFDDSENVLTHAEIEAGQSIVKGPTVGPIGRPANTFGKPKISWGKNEVTLTLDVDPTTLGIAVNSWFSVTSGGVTRVLCCKALGGFYGVTAALRINELKPGDKVESGGETLIIEEVGHKETGEYFARVTGTFTTPPVGIPVNLKRLNGIRQLKESVLARIMEVKVSPELKLTVTARKIAPEAYGAENLNFITASSPDYVINDSLFLTPGAPAFTEFKIYSAQTPAGRGTYEAFAQLIGVSGTNVNRTIVTIYAKDLNLMQEDQVVFTQTLYRGQSSITANLSRVTQFLTENNVSFYASAINYNEHNLSSEIAYSDGAVEDGGVGGLVELSPDDLPPEPGEWDLAYYDSEAGGVVSGKFGKTITLATKKYTAEIYAGLEIRTSDSNWGLKANNTADGNLVTRGPQQLFFEIKENLPTTRSVSYFLKTYNTEGTYSTLAKELQLVDSQPALIPSGNISVKETGNAIHIDVTPYISGAYENDIVEYILYVENTGQHIDGAQASNVYIEVDRKTTPHFLYSVPYSLFTGETFTGNIKVVAEDRLTPIVADNQEPSAAIVAYTMRKVASADVAIDALASDLSDNKFLLANWGSDEYRDNFGYSLAVLNADNFSQSITLKASTNYVLSFEAKKTNVNIGITVSGSNNGSVTTSNTGNFELLTFKFTTPVSTVNNQTVFTITGEGNIKKIMLNEGTHAMAYTLHADDQIDNARNREHKKQLANEVLTILSNMQTVNTDVDTERARIDVAEDNINLRVKGDDVINSINLSEEGIAIAGKALIIDAVTRFIDSTGTVYGVVLSVDAGNQTIVVYNQAKTIWASGLGTMVSYDTDGLQAPSGGSFDYGDFVIDPGNGRKVTLTGVTGTFPAVGDFFTNDANDKGQTKISGGKIQTDAIIANHILAGEIGAEKLAAESITTNFLSLIGQQNIILDKDKGILIFDASETATVNTTITTQTRFTFSQNYGLQVGDYFKVENGNNKGLVLKITAVNAGNFTADFNQVPNDFLDNQPQPQHENVVSVTYYKAAGNNFIQIGLDSGNKGVIHIGDGNSSTKLSTSGLEIKDGSLKVGAGQDWLQYNGSEGLWLGTNTPNDFTFDKGKFRVDLAGNVQANSIDVAALNQFFDGITVSQSFVDIWNNPMSGYDYVPVLRTAVNLPPEVVQTSNLKSIFVTTAFQVSMNTSIVRDVSPIDIRITIAQPDPNAPEDIIPVIRTGFDVNVTFPYTGGVTWNNRVVTGLISGSITDALQNYSGSNNFGQLSDLTPGQMYLINFDIFPLNPPPPLLAIQQVRVFSATAHLRFLTKTDLI